LYGLSGFPTAIEGQGTRLFTGGSEQTSISQQTVAVDANVGPVSAEDRQSESVLLPLEINGSIPTDATQAQITITQNRISGSANDGYVDNIALTLN